VWQWIENNSAVLLGTGSRPPQSAQHYSYHRCLPIAVFFSYDGMLVWYDGMMVCWYGMLVWYVGMLVCFAGMLVCWYAGMLVCWYAGMLV
jgi:hypothetical protein